MTKIKQRIVEALDTVDPDAMLTLYGVVCGFASGHTERGEVQAPQPGIFIQVRKALRGCRGAIADDVLQLREDRV
jgi:hypothetical protein